MAGSQSVRRNLSRRCEQRIEFHVIVALRARDRRAARQVILSTNGCTTVSSNRFFVIHHVVRHSQMLRHSLGVIHIVEIEQQPLAMRAVRDQVPATGAGSRVASSARRRASRLLDGIRRDCGLSTPPLIATAVIGAAAVVWPEFGLNSIRLVYRQLKSLCETTRV